jgi:hemin uptake protein HemP
MGLEPGGMLSGGVKVFPNPNRGQFTVELELSGLVSLQVFDARGALVHNEVFTATGARAQRTLDLSTLAKGSYTLLVEHDGQRVSQAVVVE